MDIYQVLFGVYPYIALTVFAIGCWIRFDTAQYTWKSDSTQLLDKKGVMLASNLFHIGIIAIFFGHLIGLLTPHSWFQALGVSDMSHQWLAITAGSVFGVLCLIGGSLLWLRRITHPRVRAASRTMDIFILSWIMLTLLLGLSTLPFSIGHARHGDPSVMIALAQWAQSIVTLQPKPQLLMAVDPIFRAHIFCGMTVFLLFPFSRLVHIWSAPFGYLGRAYQIVRTKRAATP